LYSQGSATDDDKSLTASDFEGEVGPVKPKDPNESANEQQGATEGNNDLADRKIERKRKREESSAGNTCKKSKVS
jgi:hypothetical protein